MTVAVAEDRIVCLGQDRQVVDGRVECPLRGRRVPVAVCLDCHNLVWHSDERDRPAPCSTEPVADR